MKLLVWAVIILAVIWLLRSKKSMDRVATPSSGEAAGKRMETMVQCAHCGVYIPISEAVVAASGTRYCSDEHRLRHAA